MANILDGKKLKEQILSKLKVEVSKIKPAPVLAVIFLGENEESKVYLEQKRKAVETIGGQFKLIHLPVSASQSQVESIIAQLNADQSIDGIVVQKPLPSHLSSEKIDLLVDTGKDVDGLNPLSSFIPATTRGILELLDFYDIKIGGKYVVVVGRSKLVGLPTALEFLKRDATVTICHSKTLNLQRFTSKADILISAVGEPNLITGKMVKDGAVVVDIGLKKVEGRVVGDVAFEEVFKKAAWITPVPGGVGPMTVASLMLNLVQAAAARRQA